MRVVAESVVTGDSRHPSPAGDSRKNTITPYFSERGRTVVWFLGAAPVVPTIGLFSTCGNLDRSGVASCRSVVELAMTEAVNRWRKGWMQHPDHPAAAWKRACTRKCSWKRSCWRSWRKAFQSFPWNACR